MSPGVRFLHRRVRAHSVSGRTCRSPLTELVRFVPARCNRAPTSQPAREDAGLAADSCGQTELINKDILRSAKFCRSGMLWSTVIVTSKPAASAASSRRPFSDQRVWRNRPIGTHSQGTETEDARLSKRALTMCHQQHSGFFQGLERPLTWNGRKTAKKLFQRVTAFKIIEKGLDRNARAAEHGNSVHRFRISGNRLRHPFIVLQARWSESERFVRRTALGRETPVPRFWINLTRSLRYTTCRLHIPLVNAAPAGDKSDRGY